MKKFIKNHVLFIVLCSVLLSVIIFLVVTLCLKNNKDIAEAWTRGFARYFLFISGIMYEFVGFSMFEFLGVGAIVSAVVLLAWAFSLFGYKQIFAGVNRLLIVAIAVVSVVATYNATVGMAYNRKTMPIEKYKGEIKKEEFKDIASYFVNDYNACIDTLGLDKDGEIKMPYSTYKLIEKLRKEYAKLDNDYFNKYTPTAKPLMFSGLFTSVSVVGIYYGPTAEANYNTYSTNIELPYYIAHEMAHGKGVMREDDAQLLTTYICINSEDPLIRMSGYYCTIDSIINITRQSDNKDDYKEVNKLFNSNVRTNWNYVYNHWKGKAFLSDLGDKVNDWYLRTFGQEGGTTSYQDTKPVVDSNTGKVIKLSNYQNIYFNKYYSNKD